MALLLTCQSLTKSYGAEPLFENVSLTVSDGERVGLIGPNGAGKSTFLEILAGLKETDSGESTVRKLVKLSYVPQDVAYLPELTARQILLEAISNESAEEAAKGARAAAMLSLTGFSARESDSPATALSGGWKKRLSIARALIQTPDILLLDEPTNHLDLEGILWLERLLASSAFACIVVSHDRYFLENIATDMAELNRVYPGGMFRVKGNYSEFLVRRDEFLGVQARLQETLENKVRREVEWLRRGPKARTTKSKARIGAAGRLIEELAEVSARNETSTARIDFTASGRKTKSLIEARNIEKKMGGRTLFGGLRLALGPGVRMGLVGRNGSGKTTLLKILAGEIAPDAGTMERAEGLRVISFDQNREQLDPDVTLRRALAPEGDSVIYRERVTHVASWARRFLFKPEQFEVPVGRLSGGERARVLIARLMLQPADVLLLDEPTNDLDIPTLEVLEESLAEFSGALVMVTHDRYMLDRVSTTVLGLDGDGGAMMFADYSQWEQSQSGRKQPKAAVKDEPAPAPAKKRLSYMEAREWETMEERVLAAEKLLEEKRAAIESAAAAGDAARLRQSYDEMTAAQEAADRLYSRWAELEVKQV